MASVYVRHLAGDFGAAVSYAALFSTPPMRTIKIMLIQPATFPVNKFHHDQGRLTKSAPARIAV